MVAMARADAQSIVPGGWGGGGVAQWPLREETFKENGSRDDYF
jgi:hypothetical protein